MPLDFGSGAFSVFSPKPFHRLRFTLSQVCLNGGGMNRAHKIAAALSLAVVVLCLVGSLMTRGVMEHLPFLHGQKTGWNAAPPSYGIVDQRPWKTAQTLAPLA